MTNRSDGTRTMASEQVEKGRVADCDGEHVEQYGRCLSDTSALLQGTTTAPAIPEARWAKPKSGVDTVGGGLHPAATSP